VRVQYLALFPIKQITFMLSRPPSGRLPG
jgi:hypothetical protein